MRHNFKNLDNTTPFRKHILVVEDNSAIMDVITLVLESESYQVTGMDKGADLLAHVLSVRPDLVILDIMLPDGDGRDLLTSLRTHTSTAHIPVLMISARFTPENVQHGTHRPNAFLAKPFDIHELLETIEGVLDGKLY